MSSPELRPKAPEIIARSQTIQLSMLRDCAERAVAMCVEFAPETDRDAQQKVHDMLNEVVDHTKRAFLYIHHPSNENERELGEEYAEGIPVPIGPRLLPNSDSVDREADLLAQVVIGNLEYQKFDPRRNAYDISVAMPGTNKALRLALMRADFQIAGALSGFEYAQNGIQYAVAYGLSDVKQIG